MRKIFIVFVFVGLRISGFSQDKSTLDTVFCDIQNTSYINLPEEVILVDVGNPSQYDAVIKSNLVFVKPKKDNVQPTTILIKCSSNIYHGTLAYNTTKKVKSYYYEIKPGSPVFAEDPRLRRDGGEVNNKKKGNKTAEIKSSPEKETTSTEETVSDTSIQNKMGVFSKIKSEIKTLGFISANVDAAVTVIRNDENNTFIKLVVNNKSSLPFKLDFISFQYYQDMKKGVLRKSKKAPIDVYPVGQLTIKEIAPEKSLALPYVIPAYALSNNGYLMVLIRESTGDRVLKIKIEGSIIQGSPQLIIEKKN